MAPPPQPHPAHRHLIGCESARLVGADDRGAAQCLHRWQAAHDGVLAGHPSRPQGQAGGDDGGEACNTRPTASLRQHLNNDDVPVPFQIKSMLTVQQRALVFPA